jgi:hypothetical protein
VGTDVKTNSKGEAVRTQQETAGMEYAAAWDQKKMHTESWKGIAAFGVRRLGEKKPIEFGSETQIKKRKKR